MAAFSETTDRLALQCEPAGERSLILRLRGELDLFTVPVFEDAVEQFSRSRAERLVVDFTGTTFLDSAGLSALVRLCRKLGHSMELCLAGARGQCLRALEVAHISQVLPLYATVDLALGQDGD